MEERTYQYKAPRLIAEAFEDHEIHFDVQDNPITGSETVVAAFGVANGPTVLVRFISRDDDNDVAVRAYDIVNDVSSDKLQRVQDACNILNEKIRYLKFYLGKDGCVDAEYDFPLKMTDDSVGEAAVEMFIRFMHIIKKEYVIFAKALYTDAPLRGDAGDAVGDGGVSDTKGSDAD